MKNINNTYTKLLDEVGVYYTNSFREIVDEYKLKRYAKKKIKDLRLRDTQRTINTSNIIYHTIQ